MLKKTIQDYNLIADEFSSKRQEPWPELEFLFDDYLVSGEKVLDLGCGNGRFFELCQDKKADYTGVDPSEKLIAIAKKKYPDGNFLAADALRLPFADNYFDKIYSIAVLHHIPSKELRLQFLKEAKRVLKQQGLFIFTAWKFSQSKMRLLLLKFTILKLFRLSKLDFGDVLDPWGKTGVKRFYHWYSEKELITLAREAGFEIKKSGLINNEKGNRRNIYLVAEKR